MLGNLRGLVANRGLLGAISWSAGMMRAGRINPLEPAEDDLLFVLKLLVLALVHILEIGHGGGKSQDAGT